MKSRVAKHYRQADKVVVVMDNLNTHTLFSWYEPFPADEALGIVRRLEIHYTPTHGSWLNLVEEALSARASQWLEWRIETLERLLAERGAWQLNRNIKQQIVCWQVTTEGARIKLYGLYPAF
ncbi:putative IS630 family transposase ISSac1 [Hollandina sp. SP2]